MKEVLKFHKYGLDILNEMCLRAMEIVQKGGNIDDQTVELYHACEELLLEMDKNQSALILAMIEHFNKK